MADQQQQQFDQLKQKYAAALRMIEQQGVRLQNLHIENGKLLIRGQAPSQDAKNRVWDQIKLIDPSYGDVVADITVDPTAAPGQQQDQQRSRAAEQSYTVKSGDTLSKIAREFYGDANAYMTIFDANRDKLSDPDKIQPGQQLVIPPKQA